MKRQSFEQRAAYHSKAADIAFSDGDVRSAVFHLRAALHAANNNRFQYLNAVSKLAVERCDNSWNKQAEPALYIAPGGSRLIIIRR